jgi:hypothetical protein
MKKNQLFKLLLVVCMIVFAHVTYAQKAYFVTATKAYTVVPAAFGTVLPYNISQAISGQPILAKDASPNPTFCCDSTTLQNLSGRIAFIDRGTCNVVAQCYNAYKKGAKAVVIMGNTANPTAVVMPAGVGVFAAQAALIKIPCVSMSKIDADIIKAALPTLALMAQPNVDCATAFPITAGKTYSVDSINLQSQLIDPASSTAAVWFKYTPTADGTANVSSCGGGADTRLWILKGKDCNSLSLLSFNDDACKYGITDTSFFAQLYGGTAAARSVYVKGGESYYVVFDDANSSNPFSFEIQYNNTLPAIGQACSKAIDIPGVGTYTVDTLTGYGAKSPAIIVQGLYKYINAAKWYHYKPAKSGTVTVASCLGGTDTNLSIYKGDCDNLVLVAENDDECPLDAADTSKLAAKVSFTAIAGQDYFIEWDERWESKGFKFDVSFAAIAKIDATFRVDMKNQTVSPEGVYLAGEMNAWSNVATPMIKVGTTSVYEITIEIPANDTIEYKFLNGKNGWESITDKSCTIGNDKNRYVITGIGPVTAATVCFNACKFCAAPALVCQPNTLICDDFDKYKLGKLTGQATWWSTWDGTGNDGVVVDNLASASGYQCLKIDKSIQPDQDVVLDFGLKNKGKYQIRWKMFVPTGKNAYQNIQHTLTPHVWAIDLSFDDNGVGEITTGTTVHGSFAYVQNTWFEIVVDIDIEKNTASALINGKTISWAWNIGNSGTAAATSSSLAGMNFYPINAKHLNYVDDIQFIKFPDPKRKVTFTVDMANRVVSANGVHLAGNLQIAAGFPKDWDPSSILLTKVGATTKYSVTLDLPEGNYNYKFVNGNDWSLAGVQLSEQKITTACGTAGGDRIIDVKGVDFGVDYCFDKCYGCDEAKVTFNVDMSLQKTISANGVHIAGDFQGFSPDKTPMTLKSGKVYTVDVVMKKGKYGYKFINGNTWNAGGVEFSEQNITAACGIAKGNRIIDVTKDSTVSYCFDYCIACDKVVAVEDLVLQNAWDLFPNPAAESVAVAYNLEAQTSLQIRILNNIGQVMTIRSLTDAQKGNTTFELNTLPNGLYFVQVIDGQKQATKRLVVQH